MIKQDVMISYNRKEKIFRFYADGREIKIEGDTALQRVFLLLENAVKEGRKDEQ